MDFTAEKLIELRVNNRFSQQEVADFIGVSQVAYSKWEKGKSKPKYSSVIKLTEFYNKCSEKDKHPPPRDCITIEKENALLRNEITELRKERDKLKDELLETYRKQIEVKKEKVGTHH